MPMPWHLPQSCLTLLACVAATQGCDVPIALFCLVDGSFAVLGVWWHFVPDAMVKCAINLDHVFMNNMDR